MKYYSLKLKIKMFKFDNYLIIFKLNCTKNILNNIKNIIIFLR